jgi:ComF family protein
VWHGLLVEHCPSCGCGTDAGFCAVCADLLPRVADPCPRCGLARPVASCPRARCDWLLDSVVAPLDYREPTAGFVHALKYRGARALGRTLGLVLAAAVRSSSPRVDAAVAVPLHPSRLLARGYNQALEIARTVAHEVGVPLLERGIRRPRAGVTQTAQTAAARLASAAHAFAVDRRIAGGRIAIVDDVLTTGATANALAATLLAAGAASCVAWVVARTPERTAQPPNT